MAAGRGTFIRGLAAVTYFLRRYVLLQRYAVARADTLDLRLRFRIEDVVGRHIYKRGEHEPELTAFLRRHTTLVPGDVVIDAGANIGWHSLVLDRIAPAGVRIFAFEPDPLNFDLLRRNLALNGATKVTPVQAGLAERSGRRTLHLYSHRNRGRHSFLPLHAGEAVEVDAVTIADFLESQSIEQGRLRLLKVDVEGFEQPVLHGAGDRLAECALVLAEFSPASMRTGGFSARSLVDLMLGYGFRPYRPLASGPEPIEPDALAAADATCDVAWLREATGSKAAAAADRRRPD